MSDSSHSSDLMERAIAGDRDALAEYAMACFDSKLRRRINGTLRAARITVLDVDDVRSSAVRRLLLRCEKTGMVFTDCGSLEAYIREAAMNVAREKVRAERSRRRTLQRLCRDLACRSNGAAIAPDESVIESLLSRLKADDRRMIEMRLSGMAHATIAVEIKLPLKTYREQWRRFRARARALPPPLHEYGWRLNDECRLPRFEAVGDAMFVGAPEAIEMISRSSRSTLLVHDAKTEPRP